MTACPLVVHIVHRFDFGGLENGLVNLINAMPTTAARHAIVSLTNVTEIAERITRSDVSIYALDKQPGTDPAAYVRLYRLLRDLRPDIVHTRNLGTLDCQLVALLAGVRIRVHGEHGWDVHDPLGQTRKYRIRRRLFSLFVDRFIALSRELETWLIDDVGLPREKIIRICNGVDTDRFRPAVWQVREPCVVGSVTRFSEIKDPLNLVEAYIRLRDTCAAPVRLLMIGDGPLKDAAEARLAASCLSADTCLPGAQLDVSRGLAKLDVFVLGSEREGISNTILEAMASGLPVVATATGGNAELVEHGVTGVLVPPKSHRAIADALAMYVADPDLRRSHGAAGRARVENQFSLQRMVDLYSAVYQNLTTVKGGLS